MRLEGAVGEGLGAMDDADNVGCSGGAGPVLTGDSRMEETTVESLTIIHSHHTIKCVTIDGHDLRSLIRSGFDSVQIGFPERRPDDATTALPDQYTQIFHTSFSAVDDLQRSNRDCLGAFLSTFLFDSMTELWSRFLRCGQYLLAIQLWRAVLSVAYAWEQDTGNHVHKGSPYAFLAYTYLMVGDIDAGFSYIYNAIEEDRQLNDVCPELNYPANAPVYLTATLNPSPQNVMSDIVGEVRSALEGHVESYRREFGKSLSMQQFDRRFLQNPDLETIKYFFVFTFWAILEHQRKVDSELMQNDFSKLKNANWLFALCLVIDKLFHSHTQFTGSYLGAEIVNYAEYKGLMSKADLDKLAAQVNVRQASPDRLLPQVLSASLVYNGAPVSKEIQCLFAAWNLRNFAAHSIQIQNVIGTDFEDIIRVLLYDIFLVIEEYR